MKQKSRGEKLLESLRASRKQESASRSLQKIVGKPRDGAKFAKTNFNG
ncbi:MAG TPA: hypothetical protein H9702_00710 [Candidatus Merdibacter merdavium]|uniref:Uncharacterized protein n=1 Tax=Candidatus Merdibacter merdavium TaxID=2838692 RepID=A0A9D2STY5_9FIRM|nr:hypothetical protein [Candidatus Merdibacter merdavium]